MICPACHSHKTSWQKHHKFHNVVWARNLYGYLMDDFRNIQFVCSNCNTSHAGIGLTHWTEKEFCENIGIEPRSKIKR